LPTPITHWIRSMAEEVVRDSRALHTTTKGKPTGNGVGPASVRSHDNATLAESASWASEGEPNSFLKFADDAVTPAPGENTEVRLGLPGATTNSIAGSEVTQSIILNGQPLGLSLVPDRLGNVRVSDIGEYSPIARNGHIGPGDRILRVAGLDVSQSSIGEVASALRQYAQADRLDLTVLRDSSHV
jgi:hypothetical protein